MNATQIESNRKRWPHSKIHVSEEQYRALREMQSMLLSMEIAAEIGRRDEALNYALSGDFAPLAKYIREGGRLTPAMRPVVAGILEKHRPRKKTSLAATAERDRAFIEFVDEMRARGIKGDALKAAAEEKFRRTWRLLQKGAARHKEYAKAAPVFRMLPSATERALRHVLGDPASRAARRQVFGLPPRADCTYPAIGVSLRTGVSDTVTNPYKL